MQLLAQCQMNKTATAGIVLSLLQMHEHGLVGITATAGKGFSSSEKLLIIVFLYKYTTIVYHHFYEREELL